LQWKQIAIWVTYTFPVRLNSALFLIAAVALALRHDRFGFGSPVSGKRLSNGCLIFGEFAFLAAPYIALIAGLGSIVLALWP